MKHEPGISEKTTPSGTKTLQIRVKQDNGKYAYASVIIKDYPTPGAAMAAAKKIRDDLKRKADMGYVLKKKNPTVGELYHGRHEALSCALTTIERHDAVYNHSIIEYKDVDITKVTAAMVQKTISDYAQEHTQGQTDLCHTLWHQIFEYADMLEIPVTDKTRKVKKVKAMVPTKKRKNTVSREDFRTFMEALWNYDDGSEIAHAVYNWIAVLCLSGLQPGECNALTIDSIQDGFIHVYQLVGSTAKEKYALITPKNRNRQRYVPISKELQPLLEKLVEQAKNANRELLFIWKNGKLFNTDNMSTFVNDVAKAAGVEFRAYMLRHQFSTTLFRNGTDLRTIMELMGHVPVNMSIYYASSDNETKRKAVENVKLMN